MDGWMNKIIIKLGSKKPQYNSSELNCSFEPQGDLTKLQDVMKEVYQR